MITYYLFPMHSKFIIACGMPYCRVRAEPKRLAELLASLPPEIEVESMVRQAIMSKAEAEAADNKSINNSSKVW